MNWEDRKRGTPILAPTCNGSILVMNDEKTEYLAIAPYPYTCILQIITMDQYRIHIEMENNASLVCSLVMPDGTDLNCDTNRVYTSDSNDIRVLRNPWLDNGTLVNNHSFSLQIAKPRETMQPDEELPIAVTSCGDMWLNATHEPLSIVAPTAETGYVVGEQCLWVIAKGDGNTHLWFTQFNLSQHECVQFGPGSSPNPFIPSSINCGNQTPDYFQSPAEHIYLLYHNPSVQYPGEFHALYKSK
ncbi:unnamed protein product [Echinostoma caproni]|uniref:CUB domain-containing protein n=1 Tax=Echinostoma caproni TaxID=27848 RepID=A0A183AGL6_9TREM|nr:unnamed protein product [Echinostoma caproni]